MKVDPFFKTPLDQHYTFVYNNIIFSKKTDYPEYQITNTFSGLNQNLLIRKTKCLLKRRKSGQKKCKGVKMLLKNKVCVISGSSRGIGAETAVAMAKEGAKLIINYNKSKNEAKKVLAEIS
jgi:hypothetical protein